MITGDYEQLDDLAKTNVCTLDNGRLVVAWHKERNCYYLKCGICGECNAITRVKSLTGEYKAGAELPEPIKSNVEKSIKQRAEKLPRAPQAETFTGMPATDLGTGELLKLEAMKALSAYARKYGLDPDRGHVVLMYGKPYITIDGYYYHARQSGQRYKIDSRPLTKKERVDYKTGEDDHVWISFVKFPDSDTWVSGLGIVTKEEMEARSTRDNNKLKSPVVAAFPWQLAQKRAEWQALRRAFPIAEPQEGDNEAGDEREIPA